MTENEALWVIEGWYRFVHCEAIRNYLPRDGGNGEGDDDRQAMFDTMAYKIVQSCLNEIGTGVYYPRELERIIDQHCQLGNLDKFELFGERSKTMLPSEVIGLGFRSRGSRGLVDLAWAMFRNRVEKEPFPVVKMDVEII